MADLVRIQGVHGCFSGSHAFPDMEAASIHVIPKSALNPRFLYTHLCWQLLAQRLILHTIERNR